MVICDQTISSVDTPDLSRGHGAVICAGIIVERSSRGMSFEEVQKDQLDPMIRAMESTFALKKRALLSRGTCSGFQRMESQPAQAIQTKQ